MPAENREKLDLDFGIEDTVDAGNKEVLGAFFGTGNNANPDDILPNDSSTTDKSTTKPVVIVAKTEEEKKKEAEEKKKKEEEAKNKGLTQEEIANQVLDTENKEGNQEGQEGKQQNNEKSTMASLAEEFQELGIFTKEEDDKGVEIPIDPTLSPEEFLKLYERNQKKYINDTIEGFLGRFGEEYRDMFDAVFVNGVDPRAYLNTFNKLSDIASLDMKQEASQEKVYKEYFRRQGFPEDKIEAKVAKAKVNGDLEDDSTEFHKLLVEQDARDLETLTKDKERKTLEERRTKQAFAQNANKILLEKLKEKEFDGIPLTDQIAKSAFEYVTQEKYKLPTGEPLTEFDKAILELRRPENSSLKMKLALLLMNGLDLSKIKIKERNEAVSKSFDWATKGREITNSSKPTNKVNQQVKETEPFI